MSPLEQPGQRGGPILEHEEIKRIFGNIPDILNVHTRIMVILKFYSRHYYTSSN